MDTKKIVFILLAIAFISLLFGYVTGGSACIFYSIVGVPCPSCGITRAWSSFFHGSIKNALWYHPLFWSLPLLPLVSLKVGKLGLSNAIKNKIYIAIAIMFIAVWLVRMLLFFPNSEPMVWNLDSVLLKLINEYTNSH